MRLKGIKTNSFFQLLIKEWKYNIEERETKNSITRRGEYSISSQQKHYGLHVQVSWLKRYVNKSALNLIQ